MVSNAWLGFSAVEQIFLVSQWREIRVGWGRGWGRN